jgi:hypothetical protein
MICDVLLFENLNYAFRWIAQHFRSGVPKDYLIYDDLKEYHERLGYIGGKSHLAVAIA